MKYKVVIFRSNPIDPDPRVEKIAFALSKDYQVHVVGWDRTGSLPSRRELPYFSLELFSFAAPFGSGKKNFLRLLVWQTFLALWVIRHGRSVRFIHACDFDTVIPALLGKWLFGCKVVYDIFDFYADHIRNTPGWLRRILRWFDYQAIKLVDTLVLVTEAQLDQIKGAKPKKIIIVYNTPIDRPDLKPVERDPSVSLRIAYIGLIQVERGFEDIFKVIRRHPDWRLDLAGFGGDENTVVAQALQLPNVTWHRRIAYDKTLQISANADVLFSICDPAIYHYASPNKVYEAMMLRKPILVARGTYMDRIVEQHRCGLVIDYGDVNAIEAAFLALEQDPVKRRELGENGRRAYEQYFHWDIMEERLRSAYRALG